VDCIAAVPDVAVMTISLFIPLMVNTVCMALIAHDLFVLPLTQTSTDDSSLLVNSWFAIQKLSGLVVFALQLLPTDLLLCTLLRCDPVKDGPIKAARFRSGASSLVE
jgi:hypothetical protein